MKTQSAKAKGRRLQQWVRDLLIEKLDVHPEDIESRSMGAGGEDLIMARAAREKFPFSIECKNTEKLNVWSAMEQAKANCGKHEPILVIKKNGEKPLVVIDAVAFVDMVEEIK
jgi:hypothetical protein